MERTSVIRECLGYFTGHTTALPNYILILFLKGNGIQTSVHMFLFLSLHKSRRLSKHRFQDTRTLTFGNICVFIRIYILIQTTSLVTIRANEALKCMKSQCNIFVYLKACVNFKVLFFNQTKFDFLFKKKVKNPPQEWNPL